MNVPKDCRAVLVVAFQGTFFISYEKDGKIYDRNTDPELIRWLRPSGN